MLPTSFYTVYNSRIYKINKRNLDYIIKILYNNNIGKVSKNFLDFLINPLAYGLYAKNYFKF